MVISERLKIIGGYVRQGSRVADIGTDHGLLPIWLVSNAVAPSAVASDLREGPASVARKNAEKAGFTDRIDVRVGNGLALVSPDEVDDIVIAGMGGETIVEILSAAPWVLNGRYRLVLQPMSHAEILREWLYQNGFKTEVETIFEDGGRSYVLIVTAYDGTKRPFDAFDCWRGEMDVAVGRPYWVKTAAYLQERANGCVARGDRQAADTFRAIAEKLLQLCEV